MNWSDLVLGSSYVGIAALEYRLMHRQSNPMLAIMERTKQLFMCTVGASYIAHAGFVEELAAAFVR